MTYAGTLRICKRAAVGVGKLETSTLSILTAATESQKEVTMTTPNKTLVDLPNPAKGDQHV